MANKKIRQRAGFPSFETLETREMFSTTLLTPPENAAAIAAKAKTTSLTAAAAKKVTAVAPVGGTGLTAEYFADTGLTTPYLLRTDGTVSLPAAGGGPDKSARAAGGIRWDGQMTPVYSEDYSFSVVSNGGVRLWVNGQLLIDNTAGKGGTVRSALKISLVAGQKYDIVLEYSNNTAKPAQVKLLWASQHQKQAVIPKAALFPDTTVTLPATNAGLIGQYYLGKNFNTLEMTRVDPGINLNFGTGSPGASIPAQTPFSVRWTGQITPQYSETYTFKTISDDGVRLYVDGTLLINDWTDHLATPDTASIALNAGQKYDIKLEYYQDRGLASIQLFWSSPSQKLQIVPASALSSTPAATGGVLSAIALGAGEVELTWTGSATATGYTIEQASTDGTTWTTVGTAPAGATSYIVTGLEASTNFTFRVVPLGSADTSKSSNQSLISTLTQSPQSLVAQPMPDGTTQLTWQDVPEEDGFQILEAPTEAEATPPTTDGLFAAESDVEPVFTAIATVPEGTTTYNVGGLTPGQAYQFEIAALNSQGVASIPSNVADATSLAPTVPTVTAINPSLTGMTLSWTDVAGETGFAIDRSLSPTDGFTQIATVGQNVTSYTDSALANGTTYYYRIRSVNAGGSSDPSTVVTAVTLVPSPGSVGSGAASATGLVLTWADVPGETGFSILQSIDGGNTFTQVGTTPAGVTTFPVAGLTPGTSYQFAVQALDGAGIPSTSSAPISITTIAASPANVVATAISSTQENLTWSDVAGETGFQILRSPDGISNWTPIGTTASAVLTYTDAGLTPGVSYFYEVLATNSAGVSAPSIAAPAQTLTNAPASAVGGAISAVGTTLNWADVTNENGFAILESSNGGVTFSQIGITPHGVTTFPVTGLTAGSGYQFAIEALNAAGVPSTPSNVVSVTTQTLAPLGVIAIPSAIANQVVTSWLSTPGATGYTLQRSATGTGSWSNIATLDANTLTYTDNGVTAGSTSYYRVLANNAGGASAPSLVATALTIPSVPVASLTGLSVTQSQVSWPAVTGASSYLIETSATGANGWTTAATAVGSAVSAVVPNLAPSTVYYYRVTAINATGQSAPSTVVGQMTAPIAADALNDSIYGATSSATLYYLDMSGGTSTVVGQLNSGAYGANRSPLDGNVYYLVGNNSDPQVYTWNPNTGNNTSLGNTQFLATPNRATFDLSGAAWFTDTAGNLYKFTAGTGNYTVVGTLKAAGVALPQGTGNMCFSPQGSLYLVNNNVLYTVNLTTAAVQPVLTVGGIATNVVFGQNGLPYFTNGAGQEYSLNLNSLVTTLLNNPSVPAFTSLTATPAFADLSVSAAAVQNSFSTGLAASYTINVPNGGPSTATDVTVTVTLGTGATLASISGSGWTASAPTGQTVVLTYSGIIASGHNAPTITMNLTIGSTAHIAVVSTFTVDCDQFDLGLTNNTAVVTTLVV